MRILDILNNQFTFGSKRCDKFANGSDKIWFTTAPYRISVWKKLTVSGTPNVVSPGRLNSIKVTDLKNYKKKH